MKKENTIHEKLKSSAEILLLSSVSGGKILWSVLTTRSGLRTIRSLLAEYSRKLRKGKAEERRRLTELFLKTICLTHLEFLIRWMMTSYFYSICLFSPGEVVYIVATNIFVFHQQNVFVKSLPSFIFMRAGTCLFLLWCFRPTNLLSLPSRDSCWFMLMLPKNSCT